MSVSYCANLNQEVTEEDVPNTQNRHRSPELISFEPQVRF